MSTYSSVEFGSMFPVPIKSLEYRDMGTHAISNGATAPAIDENPADAETARQAEIELAEAESAERIKRERADATQQAEQRLRQEYEGKLQAARGTVATALSAFEEQRSEYFARAEAEIVQLALAIAAKILHREAQVDPMLVETLVRIAVDKLREGSSITVRVGRGRASQWKEYFAAHSTAARVEVVEDAKLSENDCLLETELGVANFGLDTQLKEVEQGFFDLMALRPVSR